MRKEIYDEMESRNKKLILKTGLTFDPLLKNNNVDERKCLAIFHQIDEIKSNNFEKLTNILTSPINKLIGINYEPKNSNPNKGYFHFTFLQIIGFSFFDENKIIKFKMELIKKFIREIKPFYIHYKKLILTPSGLVLCGYPTLDKEGNIEYNLNSIRDGFRLYCKQNEIEISETYRNDIAHSTLFRFTKKINSYELNSFLFDLVPYLNKEMDFGKIYIDNLKLGFATWKLNNNEIKIL